jgi:hypothetical protein
VRDTNLALHTSKTTPTLLPDLHNPSRIQALDSGALGTTIKDKLADQLARGAAILDAPTRVACGYKEAAHTRVPDEGAAAVGYRGQIAGLLGQDGPLAESRRDARDVGDYVLAAGWVGDYEICGCWEWYTRITFSWRGCECGLLGWGYLYVLERGKKVVTYHRHTQCRLAVHTSRGSLCFHVFSYHRQSRWVA